MGKQSMWTSAIAANLAATYVAENGLLVLPGAAAAQQGGTSGMIGYGMNKAAVHHMEKSLAQEKSGLANGVGVFATLPTTLDTPMNRKWMAKADQSTWTPLEFVSSLIQKWMENKDSRPENGSLVELVTVNKETTLKLH